VPDWMHAGFARAATDEERSLLALSIATEQCDGLVAEGVDHIHLYTLNKPDLPMKVCRALGLVAAPAVVAAGGA